MILQKNKKTGCAALIVAGGSGTRMKLENSKYAGVNKVFLNVGDMPVLAHTLTAFENCDVIDKIVVVTRECDIPLCSQLAREFNITKLKSVVCGGDTRQKSVLNGLVEIEDESQLVAIHDGARCLITPEDIKRVVLSAKENGAAALGIACTDTLKRVDGNMNITQTVERANIYRIQTPQVFFTNQIIDAHKKAVDDGFEVTDDCSVAEYVGINVKVVEGSVNNIKLTTREDLILAEALLGL
ncbi:MAG: 2-C-methyl-D-erythritol 4-phosphate cytidylyltransferase [Ruminococcaceae bacterium]|nr:2-C-methyl-D-erythritol 4-phosphate cytidylyltransferase [Oscillospiraceae bacterium]